MIDFHSHVLPHMDDGSSSLDESLRMLSLSAEQGVTAIVATPHFYADQESPEEFLNRRRASFARLSQVNRPEFPRLIPGAEVRYFEGMSSAELLPSLRIMETDLLLIEMPNTIWSDRMIREVLNIRTKTGLIPVIAHVERYFRVLTSRHFRDTISAMHALPQISAEYLTHFHGIYFASRSLQESMSFFIGSDCHNMNRRQPNMGAAAKYLRKYLGSRKAELFWSRHDRLFSQHAMPVFEESIH